MRSIEVAPIPDHLSRLTPPAVHRSVLTKVWQSRVARFAGATIAALVLAWLMLGDLAGGTSRVFAEAADRVKATRTLKAIVDVDGQRGRLFVSGSRSRFEGDGTVVLADSETGQEVMLQPASKLAYRLPKRAISRALDFYSIIRGLAKMKSKPSAEYIDSAGRRYPGSKGQVVAEIVAGIEWKIDAEVWCDPTNGLPVRLIFRGADGGETETGVLVDRIEFDPVLDDSLFDLTIPEDYVIAGVSPDQLQAALTEEEAARLTIHPGVCVGGVKFGMTRDQIVAVLGEPEFILHGVYLNYPSKGLQLVLVGLPRDTLGMIIANPWDAASLTRRDFPGRTVEGIRIGSSAEQVHDAYGEPDDTDSVTKDRPDGPHVARYSKLALMFGFVNGKVAQIITTPNDSKREIQEP
ncbi:MAG: hypothetical protein NT069_36015 [Planctomycetota bacterium]|nr:hypothetical protein [Planctomycetota bacterium]